MKVPPKGGRPKRLWDITKTMAAITQRLRAEGWPETDPRSCAEVPPQIGALYSVRMLCEMVVLAEPYLVRFSGLLCRLQAMARQLAKMQADYEQALAEYEPIRAFTDEHFTPENNPRLPGLVEAFGDEIFASMRDTLAVRPVRVRELLAETVNEIGKIVPAERTPIDGAIMRAFRETALMFLVAQGFSQADIASMLDPDGYGENRDAAMLRIRKELARFREELPESYAAAIEGLSPDGLAAWIASDEVKELCAITDPNYKRQLKDVPEE